nr:hypothetical protein [Tanacetum cinerariifolium]
MRIKESLDITFGESLPEPKSSPLVEDDRINKPIVQDPRGSPSLQVSVLNEGYHKCVKEARGHAIDQVIDELNKKTLSQEHLKGSALYPWIPTLEQVEQQSKGNTCTDIYSLPLQRYLPSYARSRSFIFYLTKGGEVKQRELNLIGEDKLLKLCEDKVQASPNYKAKIKT